MLRNWMIQVAMQPHGHCPIFRGLTIDLLNPYSTFSMELNVWRQMRWYLLGRRKEWRYHQASAKSEAHGRQTPSRSWLQGPKSFPLSGWNQKHHSLIRGKVIRCTTEAHKQQILETAYANTVIRKLEIYGSRESGIGCDKVGSEVWRLYLISL